MHQSRRRSLLFFLTVWFWVAQIHTFAISKALRPSSHPKSVFICFLSAFNWKSFYVSQISLSASCPPSSLLTFFSLAKKWSSSACGIICEQSKTNFQNNCRLWHAIKFCIFCVRHACACVSVSVNLWMFGQFISHQWTCSVWLSVRDHTPMNRQYCPGRVGALFKHRRRSGK